MAELRGSPYLLVQDDLVVAQVRAKNAIGWSAYSTVNVAGALIQTVPHAPAAAPTEGAATDDTQIVINWAQLTGSETGGATITDY